ncbi:HipA domain-containing protein [Actinomycetota bacterium]|nr:HipA domain-containing protein [Actinomycetota bacterium]
MPSQGSELAVILADEVIGTLSQPPTKNRVFSYRKDWENIATPLSLSMVPRAAAYNHTKVDPFLWGLIPDNHDVRRQIGRQFDISPNNPMALLSKIGLDCAGAVRFCQPEQVAPVLKNTGSLEPLSNKAIAQKLRDLINSIGGIQLNDQESWSLAGAQAKMALRQENGKWNLAYGAEPTTHILKPGIAELDYQALNEYVCMKVAQKIGLNVSKANYLEFDGVPAICVERYDRLRLDDNRLIRVHQEDICQSLSVNPDNKYSADGGPTADEILDLLAKIGRPNTRTKNREDFVKALFFNYLMMAPDAHAKNYSLLLLADSVRLAPLYDIASGAPYTKNYGELRYKRAAMRIGGENSFGSLTRVNLEKFANKNGFTEEWATDLMQQMAKDIPETIEEVFDETAALVDKKPLNGLRKLMLGPLSSHCHKISTQISLDKQPNNI